MPSSFTVNPANDINRNKTDTPLSQKNQIPWNYINYTNAKASAENMKKESNVQSGLITGRMWDRTMKWIEDAGDNVQTDSKAWGNYKNAPVTGITEYSTNDGATWTTVGVTIKETSTSWLLETGHTDYTKRKNIYDLAGNLYEWTNEVYSTKRVIRGGLYADRGSEFPVACRFGVDVSNTFSIMVGFRVRSLSQIADT